MAMRLRVNRNSDKHNTIQIISTDGVAQSLSEATLLFEGIDKSFNIRGDSRIEVSHENNNVDLMELFENPSIEAGGVDQPSTKDISLESDSFSGRVYLNRSGDTVDRIKQ